MKSPEDNILFCFLGEYKNAVDAQRRIAIPKAWRPEQENQFYLLPGREKSLQLVPVEIFQELLQKLRRVSFADSQSAMALATIGSMAQHVVCDKQGRIALSPQLISHAAIDDKVVLLGAVTTVQIWNPDVWESRRMDSDVGLDALQAIQERPDDLSAVLKRAVKS